MASDAVQLRIDCIDKTIQDLDYVINNVSTNREWLKKRLTHIKSIFQEQRQTLVSRGEGG